MLCERTYLRVKCGGCRAYHVELKYVALTNTHTSTCSHPSAVRHRRMAGHECDERFSNLYSKDTINIFMSATTVAPFVVSLFSSFRRVRAVVSPFLFLCFLSFCHFRLDIISVRSDDDRWLCKCISLRSYSFARSHIDIYCCVNLFWFQIA